MAHIERGEERATDFGVDLFRLELGIGPHADRAADIVDEDVDPAEQIERAGRGGGGAGMGFQIGDERMAPISRATSVTKSARSTRGPARPPPPRAWRRPGRCPAPRR
jgi:hypothetical protein